MTKKLKNLMFYKQKIKAFIFSLFDKLHKNTFEQNEKNRRFFEIVQLTFIYAFGIYQLLLASLQASGNVPEIYKSVPFLKRLIFSKIGYFLSNPEKTYVMYILAQELVILRSYIFKFSLIVRYNILYIMTFEFLFYCIMNWIDVLFNFEKDLIFKAQNSNEFVSELYFILFIIYFFIYLYSYIQAVKRKLPTFPNPILQKIPDSISFLLQLKKKEEFKEKKK